MKQCPISMCARLDCHEKPTKEKQPLSLPSRRIACRFSFRYAAITRGNFAHCAEHLAAHLLNYPSCNVALF